MNTNEKGIPTVYVDADSCPVKAEIVEIASAFDVRVLFIASYDHHVTNEFTYGYWRYVDSGKEAADLFILHSAEKGDIAVTQDIGLASLLLSRGVHVISPRGVSIEEKEIETALEIRFINAKARRRGVYGKGPKHFRTEDRLRFTKELTKILSNYAGI